MKKIGIRIFSCLLIITSLLTACKKEKTTTTQPVEWKHIVTVPSFTTSYAVVNSDTELCLFGSASQTQVVKIKNDSVVEQLNYEYFPADAIWNQGYYKDFYILNQLLQNDSLTVFNFINSTTDATYSTLDRDIINANFNGNRIQDGLAYAHVLNSASGSANFNAGMLVSYANPYYNPSDTNTIDSLTFYGVYVNYLSLIPYITLKTTFPPPSSTYARINNVYYFSYGGHQYVYLLSGFNETYSFDILNQKYASIPYVTFFNLHNNTVQADTLIAIDASGNASWSTNGSTFIPLASNCQYCMADEGLIYNSTAGPALSYFTVSNTTPKQINVTGITGSITSMNIAGNYAYISSSSGTNGNTSIYSIPVPDFFKQ